MSMTGAKILIIEKDLEINELVCNILGRAGFETCSATNVSEALQILKQHPAPILIFLDLIMPVMDREQFLNAKNASPEFAPIPVIVTSSSPSDGDFAGVSEYLEKPFYLDQIVETARRYVRT